MHCTGHRNTHALPVWHHSQKQPKCGTRTDQTPAQDLQHEDYQHYPHSDAQSFSFRLGPPGNQFSAAPGNMEYIRRHVLSPKLNVYHRDCANNRRSCANAPSETSLNLALCSPATAHPLLLSDPRLRTSASPPFDRSPSRVRPSAKPSGGRVGKWTKKTTLIYKTRVGK